MNVMCEVWGRYFNFQGTRVKPLSGQQYEGILVTVSRNDIVVLCSFFSPVKGSMNIFQNSNCESTAHKYIPISFISILSAQIIACRLYKPAVVRGKASCIVL